LSVCVIDLRWRPHPPAPVLDDDEDEDVVGELNSHIDGSGHVRPQTRIILAPFFAGHIVTGEFGSVQVRLQLPLPWQHAKQFVLHVSEQSPVPVHPILQFWSHFVLHADVPAQPPPQFSLQVRLHVDPPAQFWLQLPAWLQSTLHVDLESQLAVQPPSFEQFVAHVEPPHVRLHVFAELQSTLQFAPCVQVAEQLGSVHVWLHVVPVQVRSVTELPQAARTPNVPRITAALAWSA
jgi:hypothetical protein